MPTFVVRDIKAMLEPVIVSEGCADNQVHEVSDYHLQLSQAVSLKRQADAFESIAASLKVGIGQDHPAMTLFDAVRRLT